MSGAAARSGALRPALWLAGFTLAGLAGNALHLALLPGLDLAFGGVAVLLVVRLYGPLLGAGAAMVSAAYAVITWGSALPLLFALGEALAVGLILRYRPRLDLLLADGIFWLFAGIPAGWLLYPSSLHTDFRTTALLVLAQGVGGVLSALIASTAAQYLPLAEWTGRGPRRAPVTLYQALFHLLAAFVLVPAVLLTLLNGWRTQRQIEADAGAAMQGRSDEITRVVRAWEDEHLHAVVQLAQAAAAEGMRPSDALQQTTELIRRAFPDINNMYVAAADGVSLAHSPGVDAAGRPTLGASFADQPYYPPLRATTVPYVSDVYLGRVSGLPGIGIGVPIIEGSRYAGYAFGTVSLNRVTDLLRSFAAGDGLAVTLLDRTDHVIASTRAGLRPLLPYDRVRGGELTRRGTGYEWLPTTGARLPVQRWQGALIGSEVQVSADIPWRLVVEVPLAPYLAHLQDAAIDSLAAVILLGVLVLALAAALARRLAEPLGQLAAVTTNLPDKLLDQQDIVWPAVSVAEVASLVNNAQAMAATLRQNFALLQRENVQQRNLLAAALEATDAAVLITDATGRAVYANRRFIRDFGYEPAEVLGRAPFFVAPGPDGPVPPAAAAELAAAMTAGSHASLETAVRRKDGTPLDVEAILSPIAGEEGSPSHFVCVLRDISARKAVERMKSEFVSTASHELRTPLTALRGALGLLQKPGDLDPRTARLLTIASQNTDRLIRLVSDLLDLDRIESGRLVMELQSVAAADLVEQSVAGVRTLADQAGIQLEAAVEPALVRADPDRAVQVLTNLLGNAIKFSEPGTVVRVSARREGGLLCFAVADQGRGIPPEQLGRIFDRFVQVDASDARQKGGSGLGLAIARAIVEQLGGRIWVESALGQGSTFYFTLPLAE